MWNREHDMARQDDAGTGQGTKRDGTRLAQDATADGVPVMGNRTGLDATGQYRGLEQDGTRRDSNTARTIRVHRLHTG